MLWVIKFILTDSVWGTTKTGNPVGSATKYAEYVFEDNTLRKYVKEKLFHAGISKIEIERAADKVRLILFCAPRYRYRTKRRRDRKVESRAERKIRSRIRDRGK